MTDKEKMELMNLRNRCRVQREEIRRLQEIIKQLKKTKVETNMFDQEETYYPCTVQVLRNSQTNEVSVGWWLGEHNACEVKP